MKVLVYKMAAVLCAISFIPSAVGIKKANAAEWINLSSWAYGDVSGFVSAGLLPESLSDISEYMRPIKRGEFCELIYSVLYNTGIFADDTHGNREFSDCDNYPNVNKLRMYGIINGYDDNTSLYMYDGKELNCISGDLKAAAFGFLTDDDGDTLCSNRIGFITPEEIELGTYHIVDLDTGEITQEYLKDTTGSNTGYETDNDMNIYEEFSGDGYDILRDDDGMLYVRTNDGTDALEKGYPVCRDNNYLYYANRDGYASGTYIVSSSIVNSRMRNTLIRYNLATGEREVVSNNYVMSVGDYRDNKMLFLDGLGRYNSIDGGEVFTAYPNKGLYRYGEVEFIGHAQRRIWQPRYLYKFDKDGRVAQLTDTHTEYWIYIPNDPDEEIFSY